ncbi:hypothetical protein [Methylocapsa aurea]|uniref:hypothetical protein n=1 Tax=Methylocapsa aurea TaxID=663610 RepID=UPI003D18C699
MAQGAVAIFNAGLQISPYAASLLTFASGYWEGLPITATLALGAAVAAVVYLAIFLVRKAMGRAVWFLSGAFLSAILCFIVFLNKDKFFMSRADREIFDAATEMGGKLSVERLVVTKNEVASQTHFDSGAAILFFSSRSDLYILLPTTEAYLFRPTEVVVEKEWFDEAFVRQQLGVPPNKVSPRGGVAKYWREINKIAPGGAHLGWPDWFCDTDKSSVISKDYENGVIAGPFLFSGWDNVKDRGQWFAINSHDKSFGWRSQRVRIDLDHDVAGWKCVHAP